MSSFSADREGFAAPFSQARREIACAHCGDRVPDPRISRSGDSWCCAGCEGAARWIADHGLDAYYERRTELPSRPEEHAGIERFDDPAFAEQFVRARADGTAEFRFHIDGLHCSACVWLNEKALERVDGVLDARVSYGTGQATVRFEPGRATPGDVARVVATLGYTPLAVTESDRGAESDELLTRLAVAAFCATNVMMVQLAIYFGAWSGDMVERYESAFAFYSLVMSAPAALYSSVPFYRAAYRGLRQSHVSMDLPVAIAILVMFVHGVVVTFGHGESFLDSMTMLVAFLLAGRFFEARGRKKTAEAVESVLALSPAWATRVRDGSVEVVAADQIEVGDIVVVGRGEAVPADGVVCSGTAELDVSHVTGESTPVRAVRGTPVASASMVVAGRVHVKVDAVGDDSTAGRIAELVRTALESRGEVRRLADRLAPWFVTIVSVLAVVVFFGWYAATDLRTALGVAVALLVVACPCALSLAAPAAQVAGVGAAARRGAFIRDLSIFEAVTNVSIIGIDKTGTVTSSKLRIDEAPDDALALAAAVELGSSHPIGRAIVEEALDRGLFIEDAVDVEELLGVGVRGVVAGEPVEVVGSASVEDAVEVRRAGVLVGLITLTASLRDAARTVPGQIGVPVHVLSGDTEGPVREAAKAIGAAAWRSGLKPEEKLDWVAAQQHRGETVLFAGDGVNDAAAIAAADVGVAMRSGSEAGVRAADVIVMSESLAPVAAALRVAEETARVLKQNARLAVSYNLLAVAAAAAGWISPPLAALLMPISSAMVLTNARSIDRRVRRREAR